LAAEVVDEEPWRGRGLLDKFEAVADQAAFAIIIATPEDRGCGPGDIFPKKADRAPQNVILEFAWFMGRLGRENVALLTDGVLELPTDVLGFGYIAFADGRTKLAAELRAARLQLELAGLLGDPA
jgi:predicted nucleotide-binding protein